MQNSLEWLATLIKRPFTFGAIYGAIVYLVMNHVVLPVSLAILSLSVCTLRSSLDGLR